MVDKLTKTWNKLDQLTQSHKTLPSTTRSRHTKSRILFTSATSTMLSPYNNSSKPLSQSQTFRSLRPITARPATTQYHMPEGISAIQLQMIYQAKSEDLGIPLLPGQMERFFIVCSKTLKKRRFQMQEFGLGPESARMIGEVLKNNNHFYKLELSRNAMGDEGCLALVKAIQLNNSIVHLDISSNNITPDGADKILRLLGRHVSINSIDISSHEGLHRNRIGKPGALAIQRILSIQNCQLAFLNIGSNALGYKGVEIVAKGLKNNRSLCYLNLSNNGIGPKSLQAICQSICMSKVLDLNLRGNKIGDEGSAILTKMLNGTQWGHCPLTRLDLSRNQLSGIGIARVLQGLTMNDMLISLHLDFNTVNGDLPSLNFHLMDNKRLQNLSMSNCELKNDGIAVMYEGIAKNVGIRNLNLSYNGFDDSAAQQLAYAVIRNGRIQILDLSGNKIRNEGGSTLADAFKQSNSLEQVFMKDNHLGMDAGRALADAVRYNKRIRVMDLDYNIVDYRSLQSIKAFTKVNKTHYQQDLTPMLRHQVDQLQIREDAIDMIKYKIERLKKDKVEAQQRLEKQGQQLTVTKEAEALKFETIHQELLEVREKSMAVSKTLDDLNHQYKMQERTNDRAVQDLGDKIAQTAHLIQKLQKDKSKKTEEYAIRRGQMQYRIDELNTYYKSVEYTKNTAESAMESLKKKIEQMKQEINKHKNGNISKRASLIMEPQLPQRPVRSRARRRPKK